MHVFLSELTGRQPSLENQIQLLERQNLALQNQQTQLLGHRNRALELYNFSQVTNELRQARNDGMMVANAGGNAIMLGAGLFMINPLLGAGVMIAGTVAEIGGLINANQATRSLAERHYD